MANEQNNTHHTEHSTPLPCGGAGGGSADGGSILPLVDPAGNVIGKATRTECHNGSMLLHPVVHLHVFNEEGELYLQ